MVPISHYADISKRRLDRISSAGARKGLKKPTLEEIEQAKVSGKTSLVCRTCNIFELTALGVFEQANVWGKWLLEMQLLPVMV